MNPKFEEKLKKLGQSIDLTFDEREDIRARLLSEITKSERKVLSPYLPFFYWRNIFVFMKPQYVSVLLLVLLVGGGVSVVAEKSLPGEPLYQVKTSVNENVLGLFAFTPQSKAQLHTELVVRRLEEVEKLAISGKLDATTTAAAEVKIEGNLAVIKDSVKQLESDNNSVAAAETSSKAESTLKVHEAILDTLVDGNAVVNDAVSGMSAKVGIQATALSLDRAGIDSRNSSTAPSIDVLLDQQKVAQGAVIITQTAIASSTATTTLGLEAASSSLATSTEIVSATSMQATIAISTTTVPESAYIIEVQNKLRSASDLLVQGNSKLDAKDYGEAFILYKKAEKIASEAKMMLEAGDAAKNVTVPVAIPVSGENSTSTASSTVNSTAPSAL